MHSQICLYISAYKWSKLRGVLHTGAVVYIRGSIIITVGVAVANG